ncbi:MAG: DUF3108 domain-containing protein [Kiritimatiellae bacterium]|nr:DUF3108 domain-containing protein [Kiritimatiellia bacterium]MDD5520222.1 DUF3108 domain-containing protein [Kiritimatiellia bacterium]
MKISFLPLLFIIGFSSVSHASTNDFWFPVGEKLIYRLYWGVIPVGSCEITTEWVEHGGNKMLAIKAIAKTTSVVSKIYPVDDYIETIIKPESFLPDQYTQKLHEGRHVRNDLLTFNHKNGIAHWKSAKSGRSSVTKDIKIESDTRDVLCLTYFMRSRGLSVGQTENFRVLVDDKIYDLQVTGLGYEEMDIEDFGKIKCLTIEPKARFGAIFVRKGRVTLWFSEDERRICTRMAGKLSFASLKAVLSGVEGPGEDAWAKNAGKK